MAGQARLGQRDRRGRGGDAPRARGRAVLYARAARGFARCRRRAPIDVDAARADAAIVVASPAAREVLAGRARAALAAIAPRVGARRRDGAPREELAASARAARLGRRGRRQHAARPPAQASRSDAPGVEVYAKLEFANPGGSVKDRAALRMMQRRASPTGASRTDKILIDSTSGNTGVAYSLFGAALGVPRRSS